MYSYDSNTIEELQGKLEIANSLLTTLCSGLDVSKVPMPPELLDWWIGYKKELEEAEKSRIQLIQ